MVENQSSLWNQPLPIVERHAHVGDGEIGDNPFYHKGILLKETFDLLSDLGCEDNEATFRTIARVVSQRATEQQFLLVCVEILPVAR